MPDKEKFEQVLVKALEDVRNGNPPKFFICGDGLSTNVFYNGMSIGDNITKVIYKQNNNGCLGATMEVDLS